jgi:hypothetical protein
MDYVPDDSGITVRFPTEAEMRTDQHWAHPAYYPMASGRFCSQVKRPGRQADHSYLVFGSVPALLLRFHGVAQE